MFKMLIKDAGQQVSYIFVRDKKKIRSMMYSKYTQIDLLPRKWDLLPKTITAFNNFYGAYIAFSSTSIVVCHSIP
jgi:hypothetical protein